MVHFSNVPHLRRLHGALSYATMHSLRAQGTALPNDTRGNRQKLFSFNFSAFCLSFLIPTPTKTAQATSSKYLRYPGMNALRILLLRTAIKKVFASRLSRPEATRENGERKDFKQQEQGATSHYSINNEEGIPPIFHVRQSDRQ